jgi:hypothetical protein
MPNEFQKLSSSYQRTGDEAFSSMTRSAKEVRKSLRGMSLEMAEFSKKSVNQAIELQAQLAKNAFDAFITELSKFSMLGFVGYGRSTGDQEASAPSGQSRTHRAAAARRSSDTKRSQASSVRSGQRTAAQAGQAKISEAGGRRKVSRIERASASRGTNVSAAAAKGRGTNRTSSRAQVSSRKAKSSAAKTRKGRSITRSKEDTTARGRDRSATTPRMR